MTVCYILRKMKDQSIIQSHKRPFKEIRTCLTNPLNGTIGPLRSLRMLSLNRSPSGKECDFCLMERIPIRFTAFEKSMLVKILPAWSERDRDSTNGKEISELPNSTGRKQSEKTTQLQTCSLKKKRKKERKKKILYQVKARVHTYGRAESHRQLSPNLETKSKKVQHLPDWISELLWTSEYFMSEFSSFLNRNIYSSYPITATPLYVGCVQADSLVSQIYW